MGSPRLVRAGLLAACFCSALLCVEIVHAGAHGWEVAGTEATGLFAARSAVTVGDPGSKSESSAFLYSFLGTAVPVGAGAIVTTSSKAHGDDAAPALLILGGFLMGPSFGHFYAGKSGSALAGIGIRAASILGMAVAVGASWNHESTGADVLAGVSLGIGAGSAIFDIATAGKSARRHNRTAGGTRICLTPALVGSTPGVRLDLSL